MGFHFLIFDKTELGMKMSLERSMTLGSSPELDPATYSKPRIRGICRDRENLSLLSEIPIIRCHHENTENTETLQL